PSRYLNIDGENKRFNGVNAEFKKHFEQFENPLDEIRRLGVKVYEIIKISSENRGVSFIYSDFSKGGIFPVAGCFEIIGYTRFSYNESIFEYKNGVRNVKYNIKKSNGTTVPWRYAILYDGTTESERRTMMEVMRSP